MLSRDYLEPLSGAVKRKKFAVFDIESKHEGTQRAGFTTPFLLGAYDPLGHDYQEFRNEPHLAKRPWQERYWSPGGVIDKYLNYILQPTFNGYNIYSHNGGSFDELFLLKWLRLHHDEFDFSIVPVQSTIQKLEVWRRPEHEEDAIRYRWNFLDSMKLLPMGLERACETFGLPGKEKQDLHLPENDPSWSSYLRRDCLALAEVLEKTHDLIEHKLKGEVGMTAPSTSMKLYRRRFLGKGGCPSRIPRLAHYPHCTTKDTCTGCAHEWIRQSYYGGRTEVFRLGGENLHYYDINSSYVAAMRETMPAGDRLIEQTYRPELYEKYAGFVQCSVEIPETCDIPPLPYRSPAGKLIFPVGKFSGCWSVEELRLLEDPAVNGKITNVVQAIWFKRKPLFVEMVDELWKLRDKSLPGFDEGLSALAKLMGNSLYGKFGMKQDRTQVVFATSDCKEGACILCSEPATDEGQLCKGCEGSKPAMDTPDADVWYQKQHVDAPYIIPQIAAHITALARVRLWRFMQLVVSRGGRIYYSDTDSVITDIAMESSSELGAFKDEYPGVKLRGAFIQPKVYMLEAEGGFPDKKKPVEKWDQSKVTMKGFPRDMRTKENLEALIRGSKLTKAQRRACDNDEHVWTHLSADEGKESKRCEVCGTLGFTRLEKVRTLARVGFHRGPQMVGVKKSFKSTYDKRVLYADGSTSPLVLNESAFEEEPKSGVRAKASIANVG